MTLRASAQGWVTQEKIVVPSSFTPGQSSWAFAFALVQGDEAPDSRQFGIKGGRLEIRVANPDDGGAGGMLLWR